MQNGNNFFNLHKRTVMSHGNTSRWINDCNCEPKPCPPVPAPCPEPELPICKDWERRGKYTEIQCPTQCGKSGWKHCGKKNCAPCEKTQLIIRSPGLLAARASIANAKLQILSANPSIAKELDKLSKILEQLICDLALGYACNVAFLEQIGLFGANVLVAFAKNEDTRAQSLEGSIKILKLLVANLPLGEEAEAVCAYKRYRDRIRKFIKKYLTLDESSSSSSLSSSSFDCKRHNRYLSSNSSDSYCAYY